MPKDRTEEQDSPAAGRLDDLDRRLIAELQTDPRLPYATLGAQLGVTGMTAANRLQRLRQAGLMRIVAVPNFDACGLTTEILGLAQVELGAQNDCLAVLRASPFVIRIQRVTGEYDLSFAAAFPSETAMGALIRDLQSIPGVRRLVVHHRLETVKDEEGWSAVWAEASPPKEVTYEIAPGVRVPDHLRGKVELAATWLDAFVMGKTEKLKDLSEPDVVFTIMPPQIGAGTFDGWQAVEAESRLAGTIYRHLWHRIIGVDEATEPYAILIDAFNTAERAKGAVRTGFARMAFAFRGNRVTRVLSLGQIELANIPGIETARVGALRD